MEKTMDMNQADKQPRIGWIERRSTGEKTGYNDADAYIAALEEAFETNPFGFAYHTVTKDPAVRMEADRLSYNMFGEMFPYGIDDYGRFSENSKLKGCLVDKATGERARFYDSDEYVFKLRERLRTAKDKGGVAFFTATENTAAWKAVDDVIRKEFGIVNTHAFEQCINRAPMEREMCVREYMAELLADGIMAQNRGDFHLQTDKPTGWIKRYGNDEKSYYYNADEFVRGLKIELAMHPENTDFAVTRNEAAIHKAVFDVTGDISGDGNPFYLDELAGSNPDAVKGRIIDYSTGELTEFTKSEDYLEAVKEMLLHSPQRFSFETVTDNSAVWKELDDAANMTFGVRDRNGIENSLARPKPAGFVTLSEYFQQRVWADVQPLERERADSKEVGQKMPTEDAPDGKSKFQTKPAQEADNATAQTERSRNKYKAGPDVVKTKEKSPGRAVKKRSVLARLAEKQAIVKERDRKAGKQIQKTKIDKQVVIGSVQ